MSQATTVAAQRPRFAVLAILVALLYVADQVTKWLARDHIDHGDRVPVIDGFFWFNHAQNRGIAFGMFTDQGWANIVFGVVALGAIVAVLVLGRKGAFPGPANRIAAALLVSGILGNLTDRLHQGHVTDFLLFNLKPWADKAWYWPSFNIADACICVAAGLLILASFRAEESSPESTEESS